MQCYTGFTFLQGFWQYNQSINMENDILQIVRFLIF